MEENINSENVSEVYILQMEYVSTVPLQIGAKSDNQFLPHCFVGFTWTSNRKTEKEQLIQSPREGHILWLREIAFLALMQLRWPCTGTRFLLLWEQIDKCGDCAEPCRVHRCSVLATTLQHVSSRGERATKTLLTSH